MKKKLRQLSPKHRKNLSLSMIGHPVTIETRNKISVKLKGTKKGPLSVSHRRNVSLSLKGVSKSIEHCHNISLARKKIRFSRSPEALRKLKITLDSKEYRDKRSVQSKALWQDSNYVATQMRARGCKPNRTELLFQDILDKHFPNTWKFVGDGQLIIGGKCPDYANINGKKDLIDLFGNYWHKPEEVEPRKLHFRKYGYNLLIIWENELKEPEKVIVKIKGEREEEET